MKAVLLNNHGGPEVLEYVEKFPMPEIKQNEVLIRVKATSLNQVDTVLRKGYPGMSLNYPHIIGGDIAGEVFAIGAGVSEELINARVVVYPIVLPEIKDPKYKGREHLNAGWKYFGMHINGSYCEYVAVPAENCIRIPNEISFEEAACLPIAGLTAYSGLVNVGRLKEKETFMIWGGSGGMGTMAIQIAKASGAIVVATCNSDEKVEFLKNLGADYVFNRETDDIVTEVKALFPKGIDLILDYVGPATFDKSFQLVATGGKIILCGMITGREVTFNIQQTYFRQISICGFYLGAMHDFYNLMQLVIAGEVKPIIHKVYDLKDIQQAHKDLDEGNFIGKLVVRI